jgi:hypothetical protein
MAFERVWQEECNRERWSDKFYFDDQEIT